MVKILICGDRNWTDEDGIHRVMEMFARIHKDVKLVIIEGGASGADSLAKKVAKKFNLEVIEERADWKRYGKAAGPIRNKKMLKYKPDMVVAFHDNLKESKGTKNMLKLAWYAKIPLVHYYHDEDGSIAMAGSVTIED